MNAEEETLADLAQVGSADGMARLPTAVMERMVFDLLITYIQRHMALRATITNTKVIPEKCMPHHTVQMSVHQPDRH